MKKLSLFAVFSVLLIISCKNSQEEKSMEVEASAVLDDQKYQNYGAELGDDKSVSALEMENTFNTLRPGDTIPMKFTSTVNEVCKSKGCWMTLDLPNEEETVMVKFKDYGFFVPKDIEQQQVVVHGKAYVSEVSVEEQQHYAKDGGKSEEEINAITKPKRTLSFIADGVLVADNK